MWRMMTANHPTDLWQAGGASVTGAAHRQSNLPNQDALIAAPGHMPAAQTVLAVSDGHGWAESFRSDIGAHLAVRAARDVLAWFFRQPGQPRNAAILPEAIVKDWRLKVETHCQTTPLPTDWRGDSGLDIYTVYGATLAALVITPTQLIALQIGDGDILLGYSDGACLRPLPDDAGLLGETTYSLCVPRAYRHARLYVRQRSPGMPWPDFAFLSTDGVSKSAQGKGALEALFSRIRASAAHSVEQTCAKAPLWLEATNTVDDATLCFAARG